MRIVCRPPAGGRGRGRGRGVSRTTRDSARDFEGSSRWISVRDGRKMLYMLPDWTTCLFGTQCTVGCLSNESYREAVQRVRDTNRDDRLTHSTS